jgi:hypothetical protein
MRSILFALPLAAVASTATGYAQDLAQQLPCQHPRIEFLQGLAHQYYPDALAPERVRDSLVIGFVFDSACHVVRHALGTHQASDSTVDMAIARLFPDLGTGPAFFTSAGGADAVPSREPGHPHVVWAVLRRT